MIIYSKKIAHFTREIHLSVKRILSQEIGLKVGSSRFYNRKQTISYPINIVLYNSRRELGYFDPDFFELGFHECLMHSSRAQLDNVIRHELAHYVNFINHGLNIQHHGVEFRDFCIQMGWGEEVYRATTCLEGGDDSCAKEESAVFRKVQKLMALSTSANKFEAEQAMIKSQQLLLKHNIDATYVGYDEKVVLKRIMKQKKVNAKMRSIGKILETFFVSIVYNRASEYTYLEILGEPVNVEIAEYVAATLDLELDRLWKSVQKEAQLSGAVAKNSFFTGLAKGYCDKLQAFKRDYTTDTSKALLVIEKKLLDAKEMAYPRLSSMRAGGGYCPNSSALGEQMGRQLSINPGLGNKSVKSNELLSFFTKT